MYKIAAIITVHNRKEKTLSCLECLYEQNLPQSSELDVFLTDDGCTDGTSEAVMLNYPQTHIVKGDGTLFWNRGMYAAWQEAAKVSPDFYLWVNDDTVLNDGCILSLYSTSLKKKHAAIIVGTTVSGFDEKTLTYGGRTVKDHFSVIQPSESDALPCEIFNGNIVLIPRNVFERVGFNDFYYRHSFGDFDYGIKAKKNGIQSFIAPGILGFCANNHPVPIYQRKCYSVIKRFQLLYSPLGINPFEDFHYQKKIHNIFYCILHFIKLHINVFLVKDHTACE